jgi:hypothetical protein
MYRKKKRKYIQIKKGKKGEGHRAGKKNERKRG